MLEIPVKQLPLPAEIIGKARTLPQEATQLARRWHSQIQELRPGGQQNEEFWKSIGLPKDPNARVKFPPYI